MTVALKISRPQQLIPYTKKCLRPYDIKPEDHDGLGVSSIQVRVDVLLGGVRMKRLYTRGLVIGGIVEVS